MMGQGYPNPLGGALAAGLGKLDIADTCAQVRCKGCIGDDMAQKSFPTVPIGVFVSDGLRDLFQSSR